MIYLAHKLPKREFYLVGQSQISPEANTFKQRHRHYLNLSLDHQRILISKKNINIKPVRIKHAPAASDGTTEPGQIMSFYLITMGQMTSASSRPPHT